MLAKLSSYWFLIYVLLLLAYLIFFLSFQDVLWGALILRGIVKDIGSATCWLFCQQTKQHFR